MPTIQELRSFTTKELLQELDKARKELLKVRISVKTRHEKDTSKVKESKRYIAQLLTALVEAKKEVVSSSAEASTPTKEVMRKSKKTPSIH